MRAESFTLGFSGSRLQWIWAGLRPWYRQQIRRRRSASWAGTNPVPAPASPKFSLTVEVADVDAVHAMAIERGEDIVYPLTSESWGVRRFGVLDPNGLMVNVMTHLKAAANR